MLSIKQQYYLKQFEKIDNGRFSFNWSAAFFGSCWFLYRKLYVEAFILLILRIGFVFEIQPKLSENIGQLSSCLIELLIAVLANRLYYSSIKSKIQQGYHLCIGYKPTSYLLGILSIICMITFL